MNNIVLIGYRGCGKTTVGRLLADRLRLPFVDTDEQAAQRAGKPIVAIFAEEDEAAFRDLEAAVIAEACVSETKVLSVGGGAVLREENVERLRACGTVLWLRADAGTLWARIARDAATGHERPPLTSLSGVAEVIQILAEREPLYRKAAHHEVDASRNDPDGVVELVMGCLNQMSDDASRSLRRPSPQGG